jgi:hypothetical protein
MTNLEKRISLEIDWNNTLRNTISHVTNTLFLSIGPFSRWIIVVVVKDPPLSATAGFSYLTMTCEAFLSPTLQSSAVYRERKRTTLPGY